ncbi:MAG: hypothetical protein JSS29_03585 [Proteobacteria bacterium]|nr:hypothetical protein [Pseudomonadota bacterium]
MSTAQTDAERLVAALRHDRDALLAAARNHLKAAGRGNAAERVLVRMHRALARHRVYLARELNRRLVAAKRARCAPQQPR